MFIIHHPNTQFHGDVFIAGRRVPFDRGFARVTNKVVVRAARDRAFNVTMDHDDPDPAEHLDPHDGKFTHVSDVPGIDPPTDGDQWDNRS